MIDLAVILPAAGLSTRFGSDRNKLLENLDGVPVIVRSVRAFLSRADVKQIVIPTSDAGAITTTLTRFDSPLDSRIRICSGGNCRAGSVRAALAAVSEQIEWVAVHDAARPLVSQELIGRTIAGAVEHGAAVPALAVHLTIKQAVGPLPARATRTVPRNELWAMQTPQIMRRADLMAAFDNCPVSLEQVTDDAQVLELSGYEVWLVQGEERNLKITTKSDLSIAELLLRV